MSEGRGKRLFDWLKRDEPDHQKEGVRDACPAESALRESVIAALRTVYDPEIPMNIHDLGLIYGLDVDEDSGKVAVRMTLTAPGCPVAGSFPGIVQCAVESVPGVTEAEVELVWEPPWSMERMSEAARLELGLM